jgi:hypothetical protein
LAKDDSHSCIGDVNYSDAGLVNIDDLIESLIELREKDLTMLHVIGIVITQNLRFMAENQLMMKLKLKKIKLNLKQFVGKKKN